MPGTVPLGRLIFLGGDYDTTISNLATLMKKYILGAVFSLALLTAPVTTHAAGLTSSQIQAILSLLSSFGADQSVINNVQASLTGTVPVQSDSLFCFNFDANLSIGSNSVDVSYLQTILNKEGLLAQPQDKPFNESLASAVTAFQEKYASSILIPNGLAHGTGYVGASTRAKLNQLYGCSAPSVPETMVSTPPTSASTVTAPTISNISPSSASVGVPVTVYGANLVNVTGVSFYDSAVENKLYATLPVSSVSSDSIQFLIPASFIGMVGPGVYKVTANSSTQKSNKVQLIVTETSNAQSLGDNDNSSTSIVEVPKIIITSPNGGSYTKGSNVQVSWTTSGFTPKNIQILLSGNVPDGVVAPATYSGNSSGTLTIPNTYSIAPGTYAIAVCDSDTYVSAVSGEIVPTGSTSPAGGVKPLCATSSSFSVSAQTAVTLTATAYPTTVAPGGTSKISWSTTNATSCAISDGYGVVLTANLPPNGFANYVIDDAKTFVVTCGGSGGYVTNEVSVGVAP